MAQPHPDHPELPRSRGSRLMIATARIGVTWELRAGTFPGEQYKTQQCFLLKTKRNRRWRLPMAHSVLVVDDEPLVLEVTASMLEDLGCVVITASNGAEAMRRLADNPSITILLTDINMPGMSGYEL